MVVLTIFYLMPSLIRQTRAPEHLWLVWEIEAGLMDFGETEGGDTGKGHFYLVSHCYLLPKRTQCLGVYLVKASASSSKGANGKR